MPDFEMLWDCPTCDTKKLLGKTHRHCPSCGTAQDPTKRYFPAPGEEVAVEGHQFVGADLKCGACDTPNAANASFCTNCGSSMQGSKAVDLVKDGANRAKEAAPPAPPESKGYGIGALVVALFAIGTVLCVGFFCVSSLWTKSEGATAVSHAWEREIDVEAYQTVQREAWCDEAPAGGRSVRSWSAERSTRQVPDGEDCRTERVDNGDGTFRTEEQCTPRTRSEPVMGERCAFELEEWTKVRTADARGTDLNPAWPTTGARTCGAPSVGCERDGTRRETYTVTFRRQDGSTQDCDVGAEASWRRFSPGTTYTASVGVLDGSLRCGDLSPDDVAR